MTAAGNGSLNTSSGILTQATRMLQDPRARAMVATFHQQYAHMGEGTRWVDITRDPSFTQFSAALVPTLSAETSRLFEYITFDKGSGTFRDLLTTPVGFVNNQLAPIYGVTGTFTSTLTQTNLDPAQRPGVFTRAGFLTAYSLFDRSSPILRGAFIQKEVLCTAIPMPDNAFLSTPLPTTGSTNRERVDAQTADAMCMACHHTLINPTGFTMETYNAIGAWQTTEKGTNAAINTAAERADRRNQGGGHERGRPDGEDRRLTGRAALLRAEVGAVRVRTRAHRPGRVHGEQHRDEDGNAQLDLLDRQPDS